MSVLHSDVTKKGALLSLMGDIPSLVKQLKDYLEPCEPDDDDVGINQCDNAYTRDSREYGSSGGGVTQETRDKDLDKIRAFLASLENEATFKAWFDALPRKKDLTLYKNRITPLLELGTFCNYNVESYGWFGPAVYIRNSDDFNATVHFSGWHCIEKY